jgi:hypothetical protein
MVGIAAPFMNSTFGQLAYTPLGLVEAAVRDSTLSASPTSEPQKIMVCADSLMRRRCGTLAA